MKTGIMTKEEMKKELKDMGVNKTYKPYAETDSGNTIAICLQVRKPAKIVDGYMVGSEIDVYDNKTFRVWTSQKSKAMATAKEHGLKIRLMDNEAELFIPVEKADLLLHSFGAKVKSNRRPSPETIAKAQDGLKKYRADAARIKSNQ